MARIFVIDGDPARQFFLQDTLESAGHKVSSVADAQSAVEQWDEFQPDLVVTDLLLPDQNGIEKLKDLHRRSPGLPVIAVSGSDHDRSGNYLRVAASLGAPHTLAKPFAGPALLRAIRQALPAGAWV